ncbi:unnamed protein product [Acanthoscelides obtectus]|uniref:Uncharacterized protein n=1 Tax=Acanthoscelides obtectus TaxID=200917 RepID=A0A9P0PR87_ACAOB|nr:unnamed protein product [Acanthoscelides obtectus]CAK1623190.1 hypothetical protein AOBTE_LOCUS1872 [Acanthoscelides obtectus]
MWACCIVRVEFLLSPVSPYSPTVPMGV